MSNLELVFLEFRHHEQVCFSFYLLILYSLFHNHSVTLSTFCTFPITSITKEKTRSFNLTSNKLLPPIYWACITLKYNKYLNMTNLFVCKITSENNNKQYLVSYFYKHVAFLRVLFLKEFARSIVIRTFFY